MRTRSEVWNCLKVHSALLESFNPYRQNRQKRKGGNSAAWSGAEFQSLQ